MANSSQSGNILGYASGTQPGLVSTTAQTFAGDKTLSGLITASGGILNTGLTGANATTANTAGSNLVGEVKSIIQSASLNISTGTNYTNLNSTFVTVTPGLWIVSAYALFVQTVSVTVNEAPTIGYSTDSTSGFSDIDNTISRTNTIASNLPGAVNVSLSQVRFTASGTFGVLKVSSNTNYYFKIRNTVSAGSLDVVGARLLFIRFA